MWVRISTYPSAALYANHSVNSRGVPTLTRAGHVSRQGVWTVQSCGLLINRLIRFMSRIYINHTYTVKG